MAARSQIRQLMGDQKLCDSMNEVELAAWLSFVEVVKNFLGNYRADNYKEIVNNMLGNFRILGINMTIKVHFLHSHLDGFPKIVVMLAMSKASDSTKI